MAKVDETVIGFAVYEDATEYYGMSEVTLPEISNLTEEISGAGMGGKVEAVILGAIEAMTTTLNFRTVTKNIENYIGINQYFHAALSFPNGLTCHHNHVSKLL